MRCPDCNKFVSFEEQDTEISSLELHEDGSISGEVRLANNCQDCGTELKEGYCEIEDSLANIKEVFEHKCDEELLTPEKKAMGPGWSMEESDSYRDQRYEGKGRGTRTFYIGIVNVELTCDRCDEIVQHELQCELQASAMEELV